MIEKSVFQRRTFRVEAVQITKENIDDVASWCGGKVAIYVPSVDMRSGNYREGQICIEISVPHSLRPMRGFYGDWLTHLPGSDRFRTYPDGTFTEAFEEIKGDCSEEMLRKVVREELEAVLGAQEKAS